MARKKAVPEPQEEQMQDAAAPMEGTGGEGTEPAPDVPMDSGSADPIPDGDGMEDAVSGEFPDGDNAPFEGTDADMPGQQPGDVPMEPFGMDEPPPGGEDDAPGETETDYAAFLDAVGQGGTKPIDPPPLMLGEAEVGMDDGPGELPPAPLDDSIPSLPPDHQEPVADSPVPAPVIDRRPLLRRERDRVLTIDPRAEVLTREDQEALVWHELENANRTKQILTGKLSATERTPAGMTVAIIIFKSTRVLVPLREMGVHTGPVPSDPDYAAWVADIVKIVNSRQQSDVDFVVRGIDYDSMTVVGSRRDAMRRKRRRFYLDTDEQGRHMIEEGSRVQARVVSVMEKSLRVEVFGVECMVSASGVSRLWVSSLRDKFNVGDLVVVRVTKIEQTADGIEIRVDARDIFGEDGDNLSRCQQWGRYVGQVTDVHNGRFFIRLDIGVNALSHECRDMRMPGRKDIVSLTVTRLDEKNGVALGIINRIVYNGEAYFADQIFHLTEDQKALAGDYAQNLSLFLSDGSIQHTEYNGGTIASLGDVRFTDGATEVVYFNQLDQRYANQPFGTDNIGGYGCGPTSMAIVVSSLTDEIVDPIAMAKWAYENGGWCKGQGSYHSLIPNAAKAWGLNVEGCKASEPQRILDALSQGKLVVAIMGKGHFTTTGHFIVLRGVQDGKILVADPASTSRSQKAWELSIILNEAGHRAGAGGPFWLIGPG